MHFMKFLSGFYHLHQMFLLFSHDLHPFHHELLCSHHE